MFTLIPWLRYLHILSAIAFFLGHGTSVAMAFQIRKEKDFARIRAMLDLSASTIIMMGIGLLLMGLTGLTMPFILKIWNKGWVWTSIILMVLVVVEMGLMNEKRYKILRKLVGLSYMQGNKQLPAEPPASQEEVETHIKNKLRVEELVVVGLVIPAIVLWLMIFKPF